LQIFFYRAEILSGRFRLPLPDDASFAKQPYDDWAWLARDETEGRLSRPLYKYAHQVLGAGAGEEAERSRKWLERVAARGLTVAQASGRRRYQLSMHEGGERRSARFGVVASRSEIAAAAAPVGADKAAAVQAALAARRARDEAWHAAQRQTATSGAML
jgi:hypothetical protein